VEVRWREVAVEVAPDEVDVVSGELWAAGAVGVEERTGAAGAQLVVATTEEHLDAVVAVLGSRLVAVRAVAADEGLDAWREHASVVRVGSLVIGRIEPGEHAVAIDPGRAFGWGGHATTRLALALLVTHVRDGQTILDVGTGTGVLAIAAARLGASRVTATDIDGSARRTASVNLVRNGVADQVTVATGIAGVHDLVVANLLCSTLVELSPSILGATEPGGVVMLSGMLAGQEQEVRSAYTGIDWLDRRTEGVWSALAGRQSKGSPAVDDLQTGPSAGSQR
jgi:ribosomal protein L11 methyltransferase